MWILLILTQIDDILNMIQKSHSINKLEENNSNENTWHCIQEIFGCAYLMLKERHIKSRIHIFIIISGMVVCVCVFARRIHGTKTMIRAFTASHNIYISLNVHREVYITSAGWVANGNHQISVVWMNRAQNNSVVSTCFSPDWICVEVIKMPNN